MPDVVTFDPARLLIIEIGSGSPLGTSDNVTQLSEIYSEWKEYAARTASPSGGLGLPPAMRYVGADPTSETENLGTTYFLTNGWRLKPAEGNHRWTVDGNLFTDPAGQSPFVPTDGPFTVAVEFKVTNLIDGIRPIATNVETSRKILQNRTHTDPVTGIMTVFDDDDTSIFLQADLFEDVDAVQPYQGQGADRRNRLI